MILQGVSEKTNTLYDRQGRLGLLQALLHTPSVDVTVSISWHLFPRELSLGVYISFVLSCMHLSVANSCVV